MAQPKTLDYNTDEFKPQYEFLGYTARKLVFDFLDEAVADRNVTLDVFAYDIDEPDIVHLLEKLGTRLRIFLDDAPLHNSEAQIKLEAKKKKGRKRTDEEVRASVLEEKVWDRLLKSTGDKKNDPAAKHVKRGHFSRFAHNKVMIQKKDGKPVKVLTGSANFSVRGLYVQANNVLVFDDPDTAKSYADVFQAVWDDPKAAKSATGFANSDLSRKWTPRKLRSGMPPFEVAYSPHKTDTVSLKRVADAIDAAESSVLFAVMQLGGGGSVMDGSSPRRPRTRTCSGTASRRTSPRTRTTAGRNHARHLPGAGGKKVLVPFAFLKDNVPPPFAREVNGGMGQVIHNKFVVVDFNGPTPVVFTGSSNLASGGEKSNGDNLIAIFDRAIATMFGVEAIRLVDHYGFRAALAGATAKPLQLETADARVKKKWWEPYYDKKEAKYTERVLFIK